MAEKQNIPEIRFEGFTDPWEQRKLGELCTITKGHGYSKADIRDAGTPLILYGRLYTQYESRIEGVDTFAVEQEGSLLSKGNEVIVPASGETAEDIAVASSVRRSGIIFGGDLNVVTPVSKLDPDYTALAITYGKAHDDLAKRAQGKSVVHVHGNDIAEVEISYPSESEQNRISTVVLGLDNLITLHQRKYDKLCTVKKSMLDKMFPKPGETEPEIRFEGFTDPWEQRKLGEMTDRYKELVPTPRDGYVRMGVRSHAKGTFLTEVEPGQQIEEQELSKVKADNLVVNIVFAWEHAVAITSVDDAKALVSHRFPQFSFHDDMEPGFFRYAILDEAFRWHLWLASPSGAGRNKTLNVGTMLEYEFSVPKKAEQAKIAAFFDRLDDLITLHQRKLELLRNIKKSLLDRMFV